MKTAPSLMRSDNIVLFSTTACWINNGEKGTGVGVAIHLNKENLKHQSSQSPSLSLSFLFFFFFTRSLSVFVICHCANVSAFKEINSNLTVFHLNFFSRLNDLYRLGYGWIKKRIIKKKEYFNLQKNLNSYFPKIQNKFKKAENLFYKHEFIIRCWQKK